MAKGEFPSLVFVSVSMRKRSSLSVYVVQMNVIFQFSLTLPFCLNRSCPDSICSLPFLSQRQQQRSIGSNKSICAPSVFYSLSLAIAPLSTGKCLNRELSAVCSTLSSCRMTRISSRPRVAAPLLLASMRSVENTTFRLRSYNHFLCVGFPSNLGVVKANGRPPSGRQKEAHSGKPTFGAATPGKQATPCGQIQLAT